MQEYSILFKGIDNGNHTFHYEVSGNIDRRVNMRVHNTYFNYKEYQEILNLTPGVGYYTYLPTDSKNRYVEFRDEETYEIVGLFGLDGIKSMDDLDINGYAKKISGLIKPREKNNLCIVFNEIACANIYHNDFINVEDGDIVVDIGFNCGIFSIQSLRYNPKRIVAFEPNPTLVKLFKNNFETDIIEIHQLAISDKNGTTKFFENFDTGMSTIIDEINTHSRNISYDVNVRSFNQIIEDYNLTTIDYLKVDCEGSEYDIFGSISDDYLSNNIRKIAIEFHHNLGDVKVQKLVARLNELNFELNIKYEENSTIGLIYARK